MRIARLPAPSPRAHPSSCVPGAPATHALAPFYWRASVLDRACQPLAVCAPRRRIHCMLPRAPLHPCSVPPAVATPCDTAEPTLIIATPSAPCRLPHPGNAPSSTVRAHGPASHGATPAVCRYKLQILNELGPIAAPACVPVSCTLQNRQWRCRLMPCEVRQCARRRPPAPPTDPTLPCACWRLAAWPWQQAPLAAALPACKPDRLPGRLGSERAPLRASKPCTSALSPASGCPAVGGRRVRFASE